VFVPGAIIAGKYRMERLLGEGGMGMVVAATHLGLGTPVALKFLHAALATNHNVVERFAREARASALLRGEHVCRVSDVGAFDDGSPFIVMELLNGRDLATILRENGPLPANIVCDYLLQACIAIGEAHAQGIVHRDLKPGNLFLTMKPDGSPLIKVLDFGVAKAPQDGNFSLTQTANVIGSPGYMSPEQLRSSKEADARSDIWSLGVTIYELIAGRQPWIAESITELTLRIAMDPLPPLPPLVPPGLGAVIARCMEKEPARRFANVGELAAALAPFSTANGAEIAAVVARVARGSAPVFGSSSQSGLEAAPTVAMRTSPNHPTTVGGASGVLVDGPKRGRGRLVVSLLAGSVVLGIAAAVLIVKQGGSGDDPAPPPTTATAPTAAPTPPPPPPIVTPIDAAAAPIAAPEDAAEPRTAPADAATARKPPAAHKTTPKRPEDINDSRF